MFITATFTINEDGGIHAYAGEETVFYLSRLFTV
jgi:hypothetical protein